MGRLETENENTNTHEQIEHGGETSDNRLDRMIILTRDSS